MRLAAELQVAELANRTDTFPAIKTLHALTLPPASLSHYKPTIRGEQTKKFVVYES
jgi:hypothetical protein